jgi:hypothetical protein
MKTMMMYERLVPIERDKHRELRMSPSPKGLDFARETNSVLMAVSELPLAALDFPCVFVQSGDKGHTMVAMVGLRDKENLMVSDTGQWADACYVPAFVRRYPFMLAEQPGSDQMTLCIDEAFDGLGTAQGEALFDAQGQNTPYLTGLQDFMLSFHNDMLATAAFAQRVADLGLLDERSIDIQLKNGQHITLNGFKVVDETKLRALNPDVVQELFSTGALGWIHAHLLSLNAANKLGARLGHKLGL